MAEEPSVHVGLSERATIDLLMVEANGCQLTHRTVPVQRLSTKTKHCHKNQCSRCMVHGHLLQTFSIESGDNRPILCVRVHGYLGTVEVTDPHCCIIRPARVSRPRSPVTVPAAHAVG